MRYSLAAEEHIDDLRRHFQAKNRIDAIQNLAAALVDPETRIERAPEIGLPAPRPYRHLAQPGQAWIKSGRYWVAYSLDRPATILAIFFETADIPGRFAAPPPTS